VDVNWYGIWALKKLGLARHIYKIKLNNLPANPPLTSAVVPNAELISTAAAND
jgi:hypothetical protein